MNLIGSIKNIGDRLSGRKSAQGKNKAKHPHSAPAPLPAKDDTLSEYATRLGQKLDVCA